MVKFDLMREDLSTTVFCPHNLHPTGYIYRQQIRISKVIWQPNCMIFRGLGKSFFLDQKKDFLTAIDLRSGHLFTAIVKVGLKLETFMLCYNTNINRNQDWHTPPQ